MGERVLRPESSVAVRRDEYGDVQFACDGNGPVISRTPEELGIPRVLPPDESTKRLSIWPAEWPAEASRAAKKHAERYGESRGVLDGALATRKRASASVRPDAPLRTIRGVDVRLPAHAVMGAEMIDLLAAEASAEASVSVGAEEKQMPLGKYGVKTPPEIAEKIVNDPDGLKVHELAAKYGVSVSTVSALRVRAKKARAGETPPPKRVGRAPGSGGSSNSSAALAPAGTGLARGIDVDPQRPGTAAALIEALQRHDAAVAIRFEMTPPEVAAVFARLDGEKRQAFLSAGLKAALLG